MAKQETEKLTLIAIRVKGKGDTWKTSDSIGSTNEYPSITESLEAYFQKTKFKGDFRLSPLKGELYAIETEMIEVIKPEPPKKFDIYGEK